MMRRPNINGGVWLLCMVLAASCQQSEEQAMSSNESTSSAGQQASGAVTGLLIEDVVVGEGAEAAAGVSATVHYTGYTRRRAPIIGAQNSTAR